jgi:hypothetical protein
VDIEALFHHIERTLAARPFYPCVLLVHTDIARLQRTADQLAERSRWPHLAVSRVLADALIEVAPSQRALAASVALDRHLAQHRPGPVLCVDLALLFEPALSLNPLTLLRQWSRSVPVVALWPGAVNATGLTYAVPQHAHYRLWSDTELCNGCIVSL